MKERSGGRVLRLMVAISYGKRVIERHAYDNLDSRSFASFVDGKFDSMFARAALMTNIHKRIRIVKTPSPIVPLVKDYDLPKTPYDLDHWNEW